MRRVFVKSIEGGYAIITEREHKHLSVVLRAKKGDRLCLSCGDGFVYGGVIERIEKDKTVVKITDKSLDTAEPNINCDLFLGIIKGEHLEIALQKAVELGVKNFYPIVTKNAVKTGVNLERLEKIVLESAKQCGRGVLPDVFTPLCFLEAYDCLKKYDLVVFPYEKAEKTGIKQFLLKAKAETDNDGRHIKNIAVIIGPEGGFSPEEAESLLKITTPVSLGARILRADTAAISTLTAVMLIFDEMAAFEESHLKTHNAGEKE